MEYYPPSLVKLINQLSRLPGIGEKTATRLALHILRSPSKEASRLSEAILEAREKVRLCSVCFGLADTDPCRICQNSNRDEGILCVVEQPSDMVALEKSGAFKGRYHVLHGALSPMNEMGPEDLKIGELIARIKEKGVRELVLATNTNVEGEATASYLAEILKNLPVRVTRIASGVPVGADLKYLDEVTLKRAMEKRGVF